jgi:hypothetical protein
MVRFATRVVESLAAWVQPNNSDPVRKLETKNKLEGNIETQPKRV